MLLADEFFCIVADDRTGRLRLNGRAAGLGLAAALLGELVFLRRVGVNEAGLFLLGGGLPPDALAHQVLAQIEAQPRHREVRTWLSFLAESAVVEVGLRLERAGLWRRVEARSWGRPRTGYRPRDANAVAWRAVRLARILSGAGPVDAADATLAGLVVCTGLSGHVFRDYGPVRTAEVVDQLPADLRHLLAYAGAAVGDAALMPR